jgi:hypothetical protein
MQTCSSLVPWHLPRAGQPVPRHRLLFVRLKISSKRSVVLLPVTAIPKFVSFVARPFGGLALLYGLAEDSHDFELYLRASDLSNINTYARNSYYTTYTGRYLSGDST